MNTKQKEEIRNSIRMCRLRLETIKPHLTEEKHALNESFNKLLIEKAILRDKLMHKEQTFFQKVMRKLNSGKKELICDYFK